MKTKHLAPLAIAALLGISISSFAQDGTHPRRAEVNGRLANQNARIHDKVEDGNMGRAEAAKLHSEDHAIRKEEQRMASRHDGHITRYEQRKLNRQENYVSRQIRRH
ncbi:MAG: hypothetical protein JST13_01135 [Bacteroidetes bacterium]|nr:hypothetical protein [Bacteroidota bacterium]